MKTSIKTILVSLMLILTFVGCGGGSGSSAPSIKGEIKVGAIQVGASTVFRVTLNSVTGLTDATTYNLIGENSSTPKGLTQQVENYRVNATTIPLEIYNSAGKTLATITIDGNDFVSAFDGSFTVSNNKLVKGTANSASLRSVDIGHVASPSVLQAETSLRAQINGLDILASGVIDDLSDGTRNIQVPLNCGATQPGSTTPAANEGFFIINDVLIEFNYAFDNPQAFNSVLSVKFIESDRNFDNMKLYFRIPNTTVIINARTGLALSAANAANVFNGISTKVDKNNPFNGSAIAYVTLTVTPFGSSKLVETTVTKVAGNCVIGAKSFTVQDSSEAPEPYKEIGERVDKNTIHSDLILHILGNEVEIRNATLKTCGNWTAANSGGSEGTLDRWDISTIPSGATFDFDFQAFNIPDKFRVEYPAGTVQLNTGWRGSRKPDTGEALEGPGAFQKFNLFSKASSNTFVLLVTGEQSNTEWKYRVRCNNP